MTALARLAALAALAAAAACGDDPSAADAGAPIDAPPAPDAAPLPTSFERLSETGLFAEGASGALADGVLAYEPAFALWSDGALKERHLWLPPGAQIDTSEMDAWRFPVGTRAWKTFRDPELGLLETRLIYKFGPDDDDVFTTSFVWLADGSDAVRAIDGAAIAKDGVTACPDGYPTADEADAASRCHVVPAEDDCARCHNGQPGALLGVQAVQLSHDGAVDLTALAAMGLLSDPPPDGAEYPAPGDAVERAALGALHANCGHCHARELTALDSCFSMTGFEARLYTTDVDPTATTAYQTGVNLRLNWWNSAEGNTLGLACRIVPGDPDASAVVRRMEIRDGWLRPHAQMPPEFSTVPDLDGAAAVRAWIAAMDEAPVGDCAP